MTTNNPRRRRALRAAAPVAGLLAAGLLVWQGSYAAFSATTTNQSDAWATGNLYLENNGGAAAFAAITTTGLFNESGLKPGSSGAKCLTVRSTGSLAGALKLYRSALTGTNATNLATNINLTVDATAAAASTTLNVQSNCTGYTGGTGGAVYTGTLNGLGATYAGGAGSIALAGGAEQRVVYRIAWIIPATVTDNTLQSSSAVADLNFEVQ